MLLLYTFLIYYRYVQYFKLDTVLEIQRLSKSLLITVRRGILTKLYYSIVLMGCVFDFSSLLLLLASHIICVIYGICILGVLLISKYSNNNPMYYASDTLAGESEKQTVNCPATPPPVHSLLI